MNLAYVYLFLMLQLYCLTSYSSNRYVKQNVITPQMFGAKGNGISDDREAIQKTLDHGGNIYFPKGIYRVSNTLHVLKSHTHLLLHKDAIIECYDKTAWMSKYGNAGATISFHSPESIKYPTNNVAQIKDVGIEGGVIRNRAPNNQKSSPFNNENAIGFSHCRDFYCRNVRIEYCNRKGITAQYYNNNGVIENCVVENCGVHGITLETHSDSIIIRDNIVIMSKEALSKGLNINNGVHYAIHILGSNSIQICNNLIRTDCGTALYITETSDVKIVENEVYSTDGRGIVIGAKRNTLSNYTLSANKVSAKANSIELCGEDTESIIFIKNNVSNSKIYLQKGFFYITSNNFPECRIHKPISSPILKNNYIDFVDVTNASNDTRPIGDGNVYKHDYRNWKPKQMKDKIKNKYYDRRNNINSHEE